MYYCDLARIRAAPQSQQRTEAGTCGLSSKPAQEILVEHGYRAVSAYLDRLTPPPLTHLLGHQSGMANSILRPVQPLTPLLDDGHGLPLTAIRRASFMGRLPAQPGTEAILSATHTIRVAQRAPRRSLRSSHPAELAGRSSPHRWPRSGLLHPSGPRRRCHLIVTSTRTNARKTVELRGFEPLTFCMPCTVDSSEAVPEGLVLTGQSVTSV